jgi:hypothetical protein
MHDAANDNGFVTVSGGGNTNPTLAMLERMHDELAYIPSYYTPPTSSGAFSVYVIGGADPEHVKIGKASSVLSRLRSLQTGNHLKLYVHRIFHFGRVIDATRVEVWAHQDAARLHGRAAGEWFSCGTVDAHNIISDICEKERIRCSVRTPKIEDQWAIDEVVGQKYLEREAEWRRRNWGEQKLAVQQ